MSCIKTLKENGFKMTPQRWLIVEVIHENRDHFTAEEIIQNVQSRMSGVNKSTIYRTLELLETAGCVFKSEIGEQSIYHHADEVHHHHLVCVKCGKTLECDENLMAPVELLCRRRYGFQANLNHQVITGLCGDCVRKGKAEGKQ